MHTTIPIRNAGRFGVLIAGPLATNIFEPLMAKDNALSRLIGYGRGMALMYIILGLLLIGLAVGSATVQKIRRLEDQIPDYVAPVATNPSQ